MGGQPRNRRDEPKWDAYHEDLEANLQDLSERLERGAYRATAVKRVYIPKASGGLRNGKALQRPLGVTPLEDKIVQRSTVAVLSAIYETDFLGFSDCPETIARDFKRGARFGTGYEASAKG